MSGLAAEAAPAPSAARRLLGAVVGDSRVRKLAMSTPFVRGLAWRFVAGEDLDAGLATARSLNERGVEATLNVVGTHVRTRDEAVAAADAVLAAIDGIRASGVRSHLSLKLTHVGLDVAPELARAQLDRILARAVEAGVFVRIDMEEARYVDATLDLFEAARDRFGADAVGIVHQSYLRRGPADLDRLVAGGSRIRLVRGGYWEGSDVVLATKPEVDEAFYGDVDRLVRTGVQPAIATHDERAVEVACRVAEEAGIGRDAFEFQMLLGVRGDLVDRLVREGYRVRCYVPFGDQWYAYALGCIRRLPAMLADQARATTRRATTRRDAASMPGSRATAAPRAGLGRRAGLTAKRGLDVAGALAGLVLLSPVLLWTAVAVAATMGLPILFRQERPGLGGRPFGIRKFRTMRAARPGEDWYATDADRVTRLGRFLRATSLDELPELLNVLRGEMSLVGPRPLLRDYLPAYTPREATRHAMRPGITGWAAVSGRHTLRFEDRLELDAWYVEHWSLALDLRILARTVGQVLGRESVAATQDPDEIDFPERFRATLRDDQG